MDEPSPEPPLVTEYTRLISLAVHELRTPLSVVGGYLRMLRDERVDAERRRHMLDEAERSARRLSALIDELSDVGKLDAGTAALDPQPVELFALVHEVVRSLPADSADDTPLSVTGPTTGGRLTADRGRLRSALAGAIRAVRREYAGVSPVVVDLQRLESGGRGMGLVTIAAPADLARVASAAAEPLNEKRGGVGLALPLARRVITHCGGRIWSPRIGSDNPIIARGPIAIALPISD